VKQSQLEGQQIESEIVKITGDLESLQNQILQRVGTEGELDDESDIVKLKEMAEQKLVRFRTLLNQKSVLYGELITSARLLMDLNDQLIANEEAKLRLTEEIDVSTLEIL
jgi:hypothetical protein